MTALTASFATLPNHTRRAKAPKRAYVLSPAVKALVAMAGVGFTAASAIALVRIGAGFAPTHPALKDLAVLLHVSTVVPAVPLGAWLMLAPKGTPRHKSLGKVWVLLMVLTALSALFIRHANGDQFSFIHLFVPLTLHGAYSTIATARRGDIAGHKRALTQMYLGALVIPGLFAFMPERLMGTGLFG
jgi:uncharacterized membrane protein